MKTDILACKECALRNEARRPVPGIGMSGYKAVVVGERPGYQEDQIGRPFVGESGNLLREAFARCEVDVDTDLYLTNAIKCYSLKTPTQKFAAGCAELFLFHELQKLKSEFILILGGVALKTFFPKYKITAKRGQLLKHPDYPDKWFFATFHPAAVLRNQNYESFFFADIQAFWHFVEHGIPEKTKTKYRIAKSQKEIFETLAYLLEKKRLIAFDIETSGLDPFADDFYISMIAFSTGPGRAYVLPVDHPELKMHPRARELLKELLEKAKTRKIAHNCIFDIKCLKAVLDINVKGMCWDTMIAPYLHYEERTMPALKDLAAEFTDLGHYEEELLEVSGEKKMSDKVFQVVPYDVLARYAAKDADATFRLYEIFKNELGEDKRIKKLMPLMLKVCRCIVDMELEGWHIDDGVIDETERALKSRMKKLKKRIFSMDAPSRYLEGHDELNLNSSQQKAELLTKYANLPLTVRTAGGALSTAKGVLATFAPRSKLCRALLEYSKLGKLLSTYTSNLFKKRSDDGRLRTNYNIALTGTGRLSSSRPNLQNIPARGPYAGIIKKQFGCPPGFKLIEGDFSQIELRVFSCYAKEKTMLRAYKHELDIHRITASALYGVPEEEVTKEQRMVGKTSNFALIYGISPDSLKERLLVDGDIHISDKEAKRIHSAFYHKYPATARFHKKVEKYVVEHGHIDSRFGHRKHLPAARSLDYGEQARAFRIAYNHPIQSTSAGILFEALVRVRRAFRDTDARLLATVHDSILAYVPEDEVEYYARLLKDTMEDFDYDWLSIPIPVDIQVGDSWGTLEEVEL